MTKFILLVSAVAAGACTASAAPRGSDDNRPLGSIRWNIDTLDRRADGKVQLSFRTGDGSRNTSDWSSGYDLAELQGLSRSQLQGSSQPVRFALVREAGRLDCTGNAGNRQGVGTCSFAPDAAFSGRLAAAGIGRPTERQAYNLALAKVSYRLVEELGRHDYAKPTVSDLVGLGIHGATPGYIREMADAGYRLGKPDGLIQFRIFGVKPELVRAYKQLGYSQIDASDLVAMQIHGVSPDFVTDLAALGYRNVPTQKLVELRIHGVTAEFVRDLRQEGIALPSPDQLVRLRLAGYRPGKR